MMGGRPQDLGLFAVAAAGVFAGSGSGASGGGTNCPVGILITLRRLLGRAWQEPGAWVPRPPTPSETMTRPRGDSSSRSAAPPHPRSIGRLAVDWPEEVLAV